MTLVLSLILSTSPIQSSDSVEKEVAISDMRDFYDETQDAVAYYSKSNPAVMEACEKFLSDLRNSELPFEEIGRICDAIRFSARKHADQTRKCPGHTPYIIHPIEVADSILMLGGVDDPNILIAALLHDTVEDTNTSFEEIREAYGPEVEAYVREVTDDKSLPKDVRKQLQIDNASHKSVGAAIVKLADKLNNLTDLGRNPPADWSQERVEAYFVWAKKVVDGLPLVNSPLKEAVDQTIAQRG